MTADVLENVQAAQQDQTQAQTHDEVRELTYAQAIQEAMAIAMERDERERIAISDGFVPRSIFLRPEGM